MMLLYHVCTRISLQLLARPSDTVKPERWRESSCNEERRGPEAEPPAYCPNRAALVALSLTIDSTVLWSC